MDNSSDTVLQKRITAHLKINCRFYCSSNHLFLLRNKNDAELHKDQDGSEQNFVGNMTVELWPIFCLGVAQAQKRNENQRFKPCKRRQLFLQPSMIRTIRTGI